MTTLKLYLLVYIMKLTYFKLLLTACVCFVSTHLFAKKVNNLLDITPQNSTFVFWSPYIDDSVVQQLTSRPDYVALMSSIKKNPTIQTLVMQCYSEIARESKDISTIFLSKNDPIKSLEEILFNALDEVLVYTTSRFTFGIKSPQLCIVVKTKNEDFVERIKLAMQRSNEFKSRLVAGKETLVLNEQNEPYTYYFSFQDNYIVISNSENIISQTFKSLENKPNKNIKNNLKFANIAKDDYNKTFVYVDTELLHQDVEYKEIKKEVDAFFAYCDIPSLDAYTFKIKVALSDTSKFLPLLKTMKLYNVGEAILPMTQLYVASAIPTISADLLKSFDKQITAEDQEFLNIINGVKTIEISCKDFMSIEDMQRGHIPTTIYNFMVNDADTIMSNPIINMYLTTMGFTDYSIDGVKCLCSPLGVAIVKASKNRISVVYSKNLDKAIKYTLATNKTKQNQKYQFSKMSTTPNQIFKFYFDGEVFSKSFEYAKKEIQKQATTQQKSPNVEIALAMLEAIKTLQTTSTAQFEGNVLEIDLHSSIKFSLYPYVDFINNLK